MVKIEPIVKKLKSPGATAKNVWKRGLGNGSLIGTTTGVLDALGIHPFVSNALGGAVAAELFVKNGEQKQIAIFESAREAMRSLIAGNRGEE